jgi:hypothetical protein
MAVTPKLRLFLTDVLPAAEAIRHSLRISLRLPLATTEYHDAEQTSSGSSFDLVRTHEKVSRNFPRLPDLVDHVDRECAPA